MDIIGAIAAVSNTISLLQTFRTIDKSFDAAAFKVQIIDAQTNLVDAKEALLNARLAIMEHEETIRKLRESLAFKGQTVTVQGYRYEVFNGHPAGWPFCPRCESVDGLFVRLTGSTGKERDFAVCPQCEASYTAVPTYSYQI